MNQISTTGKKRVLFIDRDGTLIMEFPPTYQINSFNKLMFYPCVFKYLTKIAEEFDYELVMVTNQDGLGTDHFPEDEFWPVHNFVMSSFANEGVIFNKQLIDGAFPEDNSVNRKPGIGMFQEYLNDPAYDIPKSFVIGDRITDVQLAFNLGCKAIWLLNDPTLGQSEVSSTIEELENTVAIKTPHWKDIYEFLQKQQESVISNRASVSKRYNS